MASRVINAQLGLLLSLFLELVSVSPPFFSWIFFDQNNVMESDTPNAPLHCAHILLIVPSYSLFLLPVMASCRY